MRPGLNDGILSKALELAKNNLYWYVMYVLAGSQVSSRKICDTQNQIGIFLRGLKKQKIDRKLIFYKSLNTY